MAKAAKTKTPSKSHKSPDQPDEPEIEEVEEADEDTETAPEEPSVPPPAEPSKPAGGPAAAKAGPRKIIIDGEGTMPLADGQRIERGKPIEVSDDQLAELKAGNYRFKEA